MASGDTQFAGKGQVAGASSGRASDRISHGNTDRLHHDRGIRVECPCFILRNAREKWSSNTEAKVSEPVRLHLAPARTLRGYPLLRRCTVPAENVPWRSLNRASPAMFEPCPHEVERNSWRRRLL